MVDIFGLALGPIIVILIRLVVPLTIFRWPLWGGLASGIVDALDVVLITFINQGDFGNYHNVDKILDWYFLLFMAIVSLKWNLLEKRIALSLFGYRTIGVILFEILNLRYILLVFPNLFLYWWYFVAARDKFFPQYKLTKKRVIVVLILLLIPKMIQEYLLHYVQVQPWEWIKEKFIY